MNTYLIIPEIGKPFKVRAQTEELALVEADETTDYDIVFISLLKAAQDSFTTLP
jgi:hypothetical protein